MRYLVAVDLSEASLLALDALRSFAGEEGGDVTLLHVVDLDLYTAGGSIPGIMEFAEERLTQAASRLAGCGLAVPSIRVEQGDSTQTILRVASEEDADLVIMTSLGKGVKTGRLFGSTAERVASSGSLPVLIERVGEVKSDSAASCRLTEGSPFERVVVAVDPDHDALGLLEYVRSSPGVDVIQAVHVVPDAAQSEEAKTQLGALLGDEATDIEVLVGDPADAILGFAAESKATAIALHPGAHGALHRALWGSVARKIALGAGCSVLFVPPRP